MENKKRILCLDGLRGVAALVIAFCVHYQVCSPKYFPLGDLCPFLSYRGHFFVEVFFMISAFCLCYNYEYKIKSHDIDFKAFISKRIIRFYPLFLISTILCFAFEMLYIYKTGENIFYRYKTEDISSLLLNIILLQSGLIGEQESFNAPGWFLSVLVLCYIYFYVICYLFKDKMLSFWGGQLSLRLLYYTIIYRYQF